MRTIVEERGMEAGEVRHQGGDLSEGWTDMGA